MQSAAEKRAERDSWGQMRILNTTDKLRSIAQLSDTACKAFLLLFICCTNGMNVIYFLSPQWAESHLPRKQLGATTPPPCLEVL